MDDSSTDDTVAIAKKYNCKVVTNDKKGKVNNSRNLGLKTASGNAVIFCDADLAFSKNFVTSMYRPIAENKADYTLVFWQGYLESKHYLYPNNYSKSYALFLKIIPSFLVGKSPIRIVPWLILWMKTILSGRLCSPFSIPDRVHTSMIMVKRDLALKAGGWDTSLELGAHQDTAFCNKIFALSMKCRWILGSKIYISQRRLFPTKYTWIFRHLPGYRLFRFNEKKAKEMRGDSTSYKKLKGDW